MSILTNNLCNEPISDTGFVVAYIRMVQIMEDDVDTPDKLIPALRQYQHNAGGGLLAGFDYDETIAVVSKFDAEIERLNGLVSMQAEALKAVFETVPNGTHYCPPHMQLVKDALSASSDTVSAWKREVQAEALENAAEQLHTLGDKELNTVFVSQFECESFVKKVASELRAKGE